MKKILFFVLMCLSMTKLVAQQNQVDSLKQQLERIQNRNKTSSVSGDSLQFELLVGLTRNYAESRPDSSMFYARQLLQVARRTHNYEQQHIALFYIAYGFYNLGNYPQALQVCLRWQQLAEENKDSVQFYGSYGFMGAIYNKQGEFRKAIRLMNLTENYSKRINDQTIVARMYTHKGFSYFKLGMLDSALWYEQKAINFLSESDTPSALTFAYRGDIYEQMGEYDLALNDYRQCIRYSMNFPKYLTTAYSGIAKLFYHANKLDSSIFYANKAAAIASNGSFLYFASDAYSVLTDAYKAKRNIDSTFKYLGLMQAAKDSLYSRDRIQQMEFITFNEQQQKRESEVEKMTYATRVRVYSLVAGLLVLILLAIILLRNNQQKQKSYNLLQQQKNETDQQKLKAETTLSKLKSTQAQLIQSEKMASLGELTAGIAHEIQNPLNFVNNFSDVNAELLEELKNELLAGNKEEAFAIADDIKENEQRINHHGKRAEAIVKGMLEHSRTGTGQKEPTDLNALADEYLRLSYHGLRAKDKDFSANLRTNFDETLGQIEVVPQDIGRVLLNLYHNAFYAVEEKKRLSNGAFQPLVQVSTNRVGNKVELSVKDNGNGIPQKILDKIFQPFFTTKPTGQGTGLGLSLSYDIVKAHGGEVKVKSKEGEGTSLIMELPLN